MDAVFIFICLGLAYITGLKNKKEYRNMSTKLNPGAYKASGAFRKLYDYVMEKGGL